MCDKIEIPFQTSGFAHPRCYLSCTNDCSQKISGEHYISKSLLNQIEQTNKTIDLAGVKWLPPEHWKSVGKEALTAKILCKRHNELLSPLDSCIALLARAIADIDAEFLKPEPRPLNFQISGSHLQRWTIKTLIGMVESRQTCSPSAVPYAYKSELIALLCRDDAEWPAGWGLYFTAPTAPVHHSRSFEFRLRTNPDTGLALGADFIFNGVQTTLVLGTPGSAAAFGILRPLRLNMRKGNVVSSVLFDWGHNSFSVPFTLTHAGTYKGLAPGHDLPRAD